jgi:hypothetical protein
MIGITARKSTRTKFSLKTGGFIDPLLRDSKANQNSSPILLVPPKAEKCEKKELGPYLLPSYLTLEHY